MPRRLTERRRDLCQPEQRTGVAGGVDWRTLLLDGAGDTFSVDRRAFAGNGHPTLPLRLEEVQWPPAEPLAAGVAEQDPSIVLSECGRAVGGLARANRPGLHP